MDTLNDTLPSLFWGYTAIWALVVLYLAALGRRVSRLEKSARDEKR